MADLKKLIDELRKYPVETQWLEFKHNNYTPEMIGQDISALANSAALYDRECAYMIWGIDDVTHDIVGTEHNLQTLKKGNQELENWLRSLLSKNADFEFHSVKTDNKTVGLLIIHKAANQTVTFEKVAYIRVGSYTKKLSDFPILEAQLWSKMRDLKFEEQYAKSDLDLIEALNLLNHTSYFDLAGIPQPADAAGLAHYLLQEAILAKQDDGLYSITNLGAILFAKQLSLFPRLFRKSIRITRYNDNSRFEMLNKYTIESGYVSAFEGLFGYLDALLPSKEVIIDAVRKTMTVYPKLALREVIANALIHQDFSVSGAGSVIEVFRDRIEVTNPGTPLVDIDRIIDNPPRSRNEKLASLMRRLGLCEELGTGWDKIVIKCESEQLPAPLIQTFTDSTRVTLYAHAPFASISSADKLRACYLHACIKQVQGEQMTNSSLRARFGLKDSSSGSISRLIKEAVNQGYIKPFDPETAPRYMRYIPIWA